MGLWMFIFNHDKWYEFYEGRCNEKNATEWSHVGYANVPVGLFYFTFGVLFELSYIPFLIAMFKGEFVKHSCYKIMVLMGIIDIFVVPCNGIIIGIQAMLGLHFCHYPKFFFLEMLVAATGFYGICVTVVILAINRFLEICLPDVAKKAFNGKRIYFWLMLPIVYMLYFNCWLTHLYSIEKHTAVLDLFKDVPGIKRNIEFEEREKNFVGFFVFNNSFTIISLAVIYTTMVIYIKIKTHTHTTSSMSKIQKMMTYQALCICGEMFVAPLVHMFFLYFTLPNALEIIAHFGWICVHGDTPIVYFIFNSTLRKVVLEMFTGSVQRSDSWVMRVVGNTMIESSYDATRVEPAPNLVAA